jgi:hypothetical protein
VTRTFPAGGIFGDAKEWIDALAPQCGCDGFLQVSNVIQGQLGQENKEQDGIKGVEQQLLVLTRVYLTIPASVRSAMLERTKTTIIGPLKNQLGGAMWWHKKGVAGPLFLPGAEEKGLFEKAWEDAKRSSGGGDSQPAPSAAEQQTQVVALLKSWANYVNTSYKLGADFIMLAMRDTLPKD